MRNFIRKLLKIKFIKVCLCALESLVKRISTKAWNFIENKLYNPYDFWEKNIGHCKALYKTIIDVSKKYNYTLKDKKLLELGPGGFLGVGAFLKKEGLKEYLVIDDINHFEKLDKKTIELYEKIDNTLINNEKFVEKYIKQLEYGKDGLPLKKDSIDIVFSNAVYEHVRDPEESIKELARVTKKGGIGIHTIDFRDHIFSQKSLFFLKLPNWIFNSVFGRSGAWVNRKRYSDFVRYFEDSGFVILEKTLQHELDDLTINKYTKLKTKYSKEDLSNLAVTFIIKKA